MAASGQDPAMDKHGNSEHVERKCGLDMSYVKSINGILKGKQIGWTLIAFILACVVGGGVAIVFFIIATLGALVCTIAIWFMFATHMYKKVTKLNWFLSDLVVSVCSTVLLFCIGIPVVISVNPVAIAAGVFGFLGMASYAVGCWYSFKRWRESTKRQSSDSQYQVDY